MTDRIPVRAIEATGTPDGTKALHGDGSWKVPGGGSLTVQDENGNVATGVTQIDFQGAGVTAASGTGEVVVTIPGGVGGGGGAVLLRSVLTSDFTTTTSGGSGVVITGLTINYTPTVAGILTVVGRIRIKTTANDSPTVHWDVSPAPLAGRAVHYAQGANSDVVNAGIYAQFALLGGVQLAAGVAYTITVSAVKFAAASTLTVDSNQNYTEFCATFNPS